MPSVPDDVQSANAPLRTKLYGKEKPFLQYPEDSAPLGMLLCAVHIQHYLGMLIYWNRFDFGHWVE